MRGQGREKERYVNASELGEFAYCSVSWKLASVGVLRSSGEKRREVGTRWHKDQGRRISFSRGLRLGGASLILLAMLFLVLLFVLSSGR